MVAESSFHVPAENHVRYAILRDSISDKAAFALAKRYGGKRIRIEG